MELEELKTEWKSYHEKIEKLSFINETVLRKNLSDKVSLKINKMMLYKIIGMVIMVLAGAFFGSRYASFLGEHGYHFAFWGLMTICFITVAWYVYYIILLTKINPQKENLRESLRITLKVNRYEKIEHWLTLFVITPLLMVTLVPLLLYWNYGISLFDHVLYYIPAICIGVLIGLLLLWYSYRTTGKQYQDIKDLLADLEEIND